MAINKSCKNPVNGIMLPFNFGEEVFFVNLLCQQIFRKFSELSVKPIIKVSWLKKKLNEKQKLCKSALKKFLKNTKESPNSIIFYNI